MVIIVGHDVLLIKAVGEWRERQAAWEIEDTALQGFHPMPTGLTVCSLSAKSKRYLFTVSLTESESILKGRFSQIKKSHIFSLSSGGFSHADSFGFICLGFVIFAFKISASAPIKLQ